MIAIGGLKPEGGGGEAVEVAWPKEGDQSSNERT